MTRTETALTIASGWTAGSNWAIKKAGIVEAYIEVTGGTYTSGWNTVATLPEGYRPYHYFDDALLDNGRSTACAVKVTTYGSVQVYYTSNLANNLRLHMMFQAV